MIPDRLHSTVGKTSPSTKETPQYGPEEDFEYDWFGKTTDKSRQIIHKKFNCKFLNVLLLLSPIYFLDCVLLSLFRRQILQICEGEQTVYFN
jgi:hypothetical protein